MDAFTFVCLKCSHSYFRISGFGYSGGGPNSLRFSVCKVDIFSFFLSLCVRLCVAIHIPFHTYNSLRKVQNPIKWDLISTFVPIQTNRMYILLLLLVLCIYTIVIAKCARLKTPKILCPAEESEHEKTNNGYSSTNCIQDE